LDKSSQFLLTDKIFFEKNLIEIIFSAKIAISGYFLAS